jgi:hypothetical protein
MLFLVNDQSILTDYILNDLKLFISNYYNYYLPNSLIIAQSFILRYPYYGKEYGLSVINRFVEDLILENV